LERKERLGEVCVLHHSVEAASIKIPTDVCSSSALELKSPALCFKISGPRSTKQERNARRMD
jgi:hypothetical protein